jgi:Mrp family chromosome partitioning ATPase
VTRVPGVDPGAGGTRQVRIVGEVQLVFVTGSGPGVGKSSVASTLARILEADGHDVELFMEGDILSRTEWAEVVRGASAGETVPLATLLEAAERYFEWAVRTRRASVYILDALFPHLPSLLHGVTAIARFVSFLTR